MNEYPPYIEPPENLSKEELLKLLKCKHEAFIELLKAKDAVINMMREIYLRK